jgi:hypothetical protein
MTLAAVPGPWVTALKRARVGHLYEVMPSLAEGLTQADALIEIDAGDGARPAATAQ